MLTTEQSSSIQALEAQGLVVSRGTSARQKFTGGESLSAGVYTPVINGPQPAVTVPPRRKGGNAYDAIAFKSAAGALVKIGLGSIFNSIRVVPSILPANLATGAKWAGEAVQPTQDYFRYGALSDMPANDEVDENNQVVAFYQPSAINLSIEVVYVVPRFEPGNNQPIFDEKCDLRKCWCVADYASHPNLNARR